MSHPTFQTTDPATSARQGSPSSRRRRPLIVLVGLLASFLLTAPVASAADKFCPNVRKLTVSIKDTNGQDTGESAKTMAKISTDMTRVASKAPSKIKRTWKAMSVTYAEFATLFATFDAAKDSAQATKLTKEQLTHSLALNAWTTKNCGFSLFD